MQTLLRELSEIGVELRPDGDRLRFRGPAGALSAERVATGVPPDRLTLVPDCGLSQTARHLAVPKLRALVAGRDLVRGRAATA